ncbi:MAG: TolB family protein [Candidatus Deferrimicrobiaceae bacterium]
MKTHPERTRLLFVAVSLLLVFSLAACGGGGGGGGGVAGNIDRVSIGPSGAQGNGNSSGASLDNTARYVAFTSTATNLVAGDANGRADVFVNDTQSGQTTLISGAAAGATGIAGDSTEPVISSDGNYVAFASASSNLLLTNNDTNGFIDVFLRNWKAATPVTKRVSVDNVAGDLNQAAGGDSVLYGNAVATDNVTGHPIVVFYSNAAFPLLGKALASFPNPTPSDVYARELDAGLTGLQTILVSSNSAGLPADDSSQNPSISASGQDVVFDSLATNLVAGDTNGVSDVFIRDLRDPNPATRMRRVSLDNAGVQATLPSYFASVSATGRFVVFTSDASLVPGDLNTQPDVYLRDLVGNTTTLVSVGTNGNSGNLPSTGFYALAVSNDGRYVVFTSRASDLVTGDTNSTAFHDVFVRDLVNGVTRRANVTLGGTQANSESYEVAISGDGKFLAFSSAANNLITGDTNGFIDVFYMAVP